MSEKGERDLSEQEALAPTVFEWGLLTGTHGIHAYWEATLGERWICLADV